MNRRPLEEDRPRQTMNAIVWVWLSLVLLGGSHPDPFRSLLINKPGAVMPLPAVTLETLDRHSVDLRNLTGRVVLLNFWATWCAPCKEEMPALDWLHQQFKPDEFRVYTVTADIRPERFGNFGDTWIFTCRFCSIPMKTLTQALMVRHLPTSILVDPDGRIAGRATGPRQWQSPAAVHLIEALTSRIQ